MKWALRGLLLAAVSFLVGFTYSYQLPRFKTWALVQVVELSKKYLPVIVFPKSMEFTAFPLGVQLNQISIKPQGDLAKALAPAKIESVKISLRTLSLFTGNLGLSQILITRPEVTILLEKNSEPSSRKQISQRLFSLTKILENPIHSLEIQDGVLQFRSTDAGLDGRIEDLDLQIENNRQSALLSISTPRISLKQQSMKQSATSLALKTELLITKKAISLQGIKLERENSYLLTTGTIEADVERLKFISADLKTRGLFDLEKVRQWALEFDPNLKIPQLKGIVGWDASLFQQPQHPPEMKLAVEAENLGLNQLYFGQVHISGKGAPELLKFYEFNVESEAGKIHLVDSELIFNDEKVQMASKVNIQRIQLQKFLTQLGLKNIPVLLTVNGTVPCSATFKPKFDISCQGELETTNLVVYTGKQLTEPSTIVAVPKVRIVGQVNVNDQRVQTEGKLLLNSSQGTVSGTVSYADGFFFKYKTDKLNFSDITNLANLKLEGSVALDGTTEGNSDAGRIQMKVQGQDIWFENYAIGQVKTDLGFAKGVISFNQIDGLFQTTKFKGQLAVNLDEKRISASAQIPYIELQDLQKMFSRRVTLPFQAFGAGEGSLIVEGPLNFSLLSYQLKSSFAKGEVANETFDQLYFQVKSKNGNVSAERVEVIKGSGHAKLSGEAVPSGQMQVTIAGEGFRLEDSETLARSGLNVNGALSFTSTLKGFILEPTTQTQGRIVDTKITGSSLSDSTFQIGTTPQVYKFNANFLGGQVITDMTLPTQKGLPFEFHLKTEKWDFAPLLGFLSSETVSRSFETELTSKIDLTSERGGLWKSTGPIEIQSLRLKRGVENLSTTTPIHGEFKGGVLTIPPARLAGSSSYLVFQSKASTEDQLNILFRGKIEMSLLSFLTPFLDEISGTLSLSGQVNGPISRASLAGTAFVENGYVRTPALPHSFESIRGDFLFNDRRIIVNRLESDFAGGKLFAEGSLEPKTSSNVQLQVRANLENVQLNIPKGVATRGSAQFNLSGSWFPYLLQGTYQIRDGLVTSNFEEETADTSGGIRRNSFLPKSVLQKNFEVLRYDLKLLSQNPIKVRNTLLEGDVTGDLNIQGTASQPILLGELNAVKGSKLYFKETPFEVLTASIKFNNPKENNPVIYTTARSRFQEYDVSLLAQGTAKDLRISLTSQPGLPEQDIISLLALGVTSRDLDKQKSNQQVTNNSFELGSALFSRNALGSQIKKRYGIDVKFSQTANQSDKAQMPRVTLSKQWTPRIGTSASRTVGNQVVQDVKLEYLVNNNVSVVGSWEGRSFSEDAGSKQTQDVLGLDLQYKVEFR